MKDSKKDTPENIWILAERCKVHIKNKFGFEPDYTGDTLSILDHFVEALLTEENEGVIPDLDSDIRTNVLELFAPTLGAYFGQTAANVFGGRWRRTDLEPSDWKFEFNTFFLRFNPVGVAANVIAGQDLDDFGATLATLPKLAPKLEERFEAAPRIEEKDFFTFCNYFESLQIAGEYLLDIARKEGPVDCQPSTYDLVLGAMDKTR